jgi:nucleotide-binding universal stress UspA family protein
MIHVKNIMVPIDFSGPSRKAINYGMSLALEFEARLVLVHISAFEREAYESAKHRLLDLIPAEYRERLDFEIIVKSGDVREEILGIVRDKGIDLVVMGTHGRTYIERVLLGSVTERMLRKLPVPILTVSHLDPDKEIHEIAPVPLRRILYASDLSAGSEAGLTFSIRLANALDAHLTVAHVVEPINAALAGLDTAAYLLQDGSGIRAQAEERLNRTVALYSNGNLPITTILADGVPCETINKLAEEQKADLIVINLQGSSRFERALLGSTAERVIRTATAPVLSLPLPATYASRWNAA